MERGGCALGSSSLMRDKVDFSEPIPLAADGITRSVPAIAKTEMRQGESGSVKVHPRRR